MGALLSNKNERHAAWERFFWLMVQIEPPKWVPLKTPETFICLAFLTFLHPADADAACWQSVDLEPENAFYTTF